MKVAHEPFRSSMNSSFTGYLREPLSTECSRMCATPVSSEGSVGNVTAKVLFSSWLTSDSTSAPVRLCRKRRAAVSNSGMDCSRTSSKPAIAPDIVILHNRGSEQATDRVVEIWLAGERLTTGSRLEFLLLRSTGYDAGGNAARCQLGRPGRPLR